MSDPIYVILAYPFPCFGVFSIGVSDTDVVEYVLMLSVPVLSYTSVISLPLLTFRNSELYPFVYPLNLPL